MPTTQDTPNMNATLGTETECLDRIRSLLKEADILPIFPLTTSEVVELTRTGGFDSSNELLENWCQSGMVPGMEKHRGCHHWKAQDVLVAIIHLDAWRRWIPSHPKHLQKMTAVELAEAQAREHGCTIFPDLEAFDVNAFIHVISECNDANTRHTFAVALKTKLRELGVLDK